jgi:hypothetical protein
VKTCLFILLFCVILTAQAHGFVIDLKGWQDISDKHFIVYYKTGLGDNSPRQILNKAEEYYSIIADRIGYERYQNFWTWEQRVPIIYFSSLEEYVKTTGQPRWSKGFSISHLSSVNFRMIVTFKGQDDFLTGTLPHEISHLILHDFIGPRRVIPLWFDEGVAQLEEQRDEKNYRSIFAHLIASGHSMPLPLLQAVRPGMALNERDSSIFYAESLYIVDFLVKTYGKEDFINLCRSLRDGKGFEDALKSAYYPSLDTSDKLQDEWIKYMMQYM